MILNASREERRRWTIVQRGPRATSWVAFGDGDAWTQRFVTTSAKLEKRTIYRHHLFHDVTVESNVGCNKQRGTSSALSSFVGSVVLQFLDVVRRFSLCPTNLVHTPNPSSKMDTRSPCKFVNGYPVLLNCSFDNLLNLHVGMHCAVRLPFV